MYYVWYDSWRDLYCVLYSWDDDLIVYASFYYYDEACSYAIHQNCWECGDPYCDICYLDDDYYYD